MTEFIITADRSEGVVNVETTAMVVAQDDARREDVVIVLDVADALFLARRLLEEIGTFEGLAR